MTVAEYAEALRSTSQDLSEDDALTRAMKQFNEDRAAHSAILATLASTAVSDPDLAESLQHYAYEDNTPRELTEALAALRNMWGDAL